MSFDRKTYMHAYYLANKEKYVARRYAWIEKNPERNVVNRKGWQVANRARFAILQRRANLKRYGLSVEDYERMLSFQGGLCAICHRPPSSKRLAVDHCHLSGRVRGLLCTKCNSTLGWVEIHASEFAAYRERHARTKEAKVS